MNGKYIMNNSPPVGTLACWTFTLVPPPPPPLLLLLLVDAGAVFVAGAAAGAGAGAGVAVVVVVVGVPSTVFVGAGGSSSMTTCSWPSLVLTTYSVTPAFRMSPKRLLTRDASTTSIQRKRDKHHEILKMGNAVVGNHSG